MYDFNEQLQKDEAIYKIGSGGGDYFNIEEGNNNICRVLTAGAVHGNHFMGKGIKSPICYGYEKGCPIRTKDDEGNLTPVHADVSVRYCLYVLDRKDNQVKTAFFGYSIMKQIGALQKNPDYEFKDLPMPYDIRITYDKSAPNASKYRVEYKPNGLDLTAQNSAELDRKAAESTPEQIVEKMKQKQYRLDDEAGRRKSPEQLEAEQAVWKQDFIEKSQEQQLKNPEKVIEYPKDEINPDDIPF